MSGTSVIRNYLYTKCEVANTFFFIQDITKKDLDQGEERGGGERMRIEHRKLGLWRRNFERYFDLKEVS